MNRTLTIATWVGLGASLAGLVVSLAWLRIDRTGSDLAVHSNWISLTPFLLASACTWLCLTVVWRRLLVKDGLEQRSPGRTVGMVFAVALGLRILVIALSEPALSDDIYRYIFDGRNLAAGLNPYLVKPADRANAESERWPGEREIVPMLAYGEMATPYMPLSQYALGALGLMLHESWGDPASTARVFRTGFVAIELLMIAALLHAVVRRGKSAWWVALYAWHPLPLAEIAHAGHQDIVGIALLVFALTLCESAPQRTWLWSMSLAAASMVKPVAAPVALFLLRSRPAKTWVISFVIAGSLAMIIALPLRWLPFVGLDPFEYWYATAREMSDKWAHFAGVYEPVEWFSRQLFPATAESPAGWNLVQERRARWACMAMLALAMLLIWRARIDHWKSAAALMLAIVLLSTTAHPWYLLWAFAMFPLAPSWTLWVYSFTISLGYVVFITGKGSYAGEQWTVPPGALLAGYVPVAAALLLDLLQFRRARKMMAA